MNFIDSRCEERLGPFRCELSKRHEGYCRFDSEAKGESAKLAKDVVCLVRNEVNLSYPHEVIIKNVEFLLRDKLVSCDEEFHRCLRKRATHFANERWLQKAPSSIPSAFDVDALYDFAARELRSAYRCGERERG